MSSTARGVTCCENISERWSNLRPLSSLRNERSSSNSPISCLASGEHGCSEGGSSYLPCSNSEANPVIVRHFFFSSGQLLCQIQLTNTQDHHVAFCNSVALQGKLYLTDPVEGKQTSPPATIGQLSQAFLSCGSDCAFENARYRMSHRLGHVRLLEKMNSVQSQDLHHSSLGSGRNDGTKLGGKGHDWYRQQCSGLNDVALLAESGH